MKRLAVCISHPIQHFSPWFAAMAGEPDIDLRVYYGSRHGQQESLDAGFGQKFSWDIPLLEGYNYEFLNNKSLRPGVNKFFGVWIPDLLKRISMFNPHTVMILGWQLLFYWHAAICAKRLGIPYIIRGESNLLKRGSSFRWRIKTETIGRLCRGAAYCLAIGKLNASLYEAYGVPRERIKIAPYVVDNERFADYARRLRSDRDELRRTFGIPKDDTVFLFIGKLVPKKRPDDLVKAFLSLPQKVREWSSLLIVGDGVMRTSLEEIARGHANIRFAGFLNQSRIPEVYAVSDVLVLPSDAGETWGLVVNEAMASGLPAIVSDHVGCAPDLVIEGKTGFIYPLGDVKKLAEIMKLFVEQPEMISRLGKEAGFHIQEFSIQRVVKEVQSVLQKIG